MSDVLFSVFPNDRFVDLGLYQYGWEKCDPSHSYGPATRNHYLFHYVISGTGTLQIHNTDGITIDHSVKSEQGFLISPKQIATYYADAIHPWEYTWLEFDGLRVKEALEIAGLSWDSPIYRSQERELSKMMCDEMLYIAEHKEESVLHLIGHLYLFLDYLTRSSASKKMIKSGKLRDYYLQEALSFIEQNFQNNISIEDIADCCKLNRSYFGKIFRDSIGKSPQEFLISYRMSKATQLLKLTELSIADIGSAVGYENQLHFSRAFKSIYSLSPQKWRNQNK